MSLTLDRVSKSYRTRTGRKDVLSGIDAVFEPGRSVGILGAPSSGKSSLVQILSGAQEPSEGIVRRTSRVSFIVGSGALINRKLTVREIITFTARLYGADARRTTDFVADFSDLGGHLDHRLDTHARDRRAQLVFGLSYSLPFDIYLADEAVVGGPLWFRERCAALVHERRKTAGLVFATRTVRTVQAFADMACILHEGRLVSFATIEEAIAAYEALNPRARTTGSVEELAEESEEEEADAMLGLF